MSDKSQEEDSPSQKLIPKTSDIYDETQANQPVYTSVNEKIIILKCKTRKIKLQLNHIIALKEIIGLCFLTIPDNSIINRPDSIKEALFGCLVCICIDTSESCSLNMQVQLLNWYKKRLNTLATILKLNSVIKHSLLLPIENKIHYIDLGSQEFLKVSIEPFKNSIINFANNLYSEIKRAFTENLDRFTISLVNSKSIQNERLTVGDKSVEQLISFSKGGSINSYCTDTRRPCNNNFFSETGNNSTKDPNLDNFVLSQSSDSISNGFMNEEINQIEFGEFIQAERISAYFENNPIELKVTNLTGIPIENFDATEHNGMGDSTTNIGHKHSLILEPVSALTKKKELGNNKIVSDHKKYRTKNRKSIPNYLGRINAYEETISKNTSLISKLKELLTFLNKKFMILSELLIENSTQDANNLLDNENLNTSILHLLEESDIQPPSPITVLLFEFISFLLVHKWFDSRVSILIEALSYHLNSSKEIVKQIEEKFESTLFASLSLNKVKRKKFNKKKALKIAAAAAGGGVIVALSATVAAPGIIAGLSALGLSGLSFFGSASGLALVASLFGASGASLAGWKYSKRVANIDTFEFERLSLHQSKSLRVIVCVSGCLRSLEDITEPWKQNLYSESYDLHALRWEPELLLNILKYIGSDVSKNLAMQASQVGLKFTAAGMLSGALFLPISTLRYAANLDNIWLTLKERSKQAGELLANAITNHKLIGQRPVSLIGYSLGARVIYYCLLKLHNMDLKHNIKDVILMGLPTSLNKSNWGKARDVVSGRLVNIYFSSDWFIAFLYRYMEWGIKVAALSPVEGVNGIENYDVSAIIKNHFDYPVYMSDIFSLIKLSM